MSDMVMLTIATNINNKMMGCYCASFYSGAKVTTNQLLEFVFKK
jgi:hypothetical protein